MTRQLACPALHQNFSRTARIGAFTADASAARECRSVRLSFEIDQYLDLGTGRIAQGIEAIFDNVIE
jgi:hypothetical protein